MLREHLDDDEVRFSVAPKRLSGGAFSEVYGFRLATSGGHPGQPLVLRTYGRGTNPVQPRLEQAVQNGLADAGFPAARVLVAQCDPHGPGAMFVVMEWLPGRGVLRGIRWDQFLRDFPRLYTRWPERLAAVALRLHNVDPSPILASAREYGIGAAQRSTHRHSELVAISLEELGDRRTSEAVAWLKDNEPRPPASPSIVHGDLWPANVLMRRRELTGVVDLNMAGLGDPALDVGFACAGLALMPAPFPPPSPIRQAVNMAGRNIARRVKQRYLERAHVPVERIEFYEALRCMVELVAVLEYRHHAAAKGNGIPKPPWDNGAKALAAHFAIITGVPLTIE